MNLPVAGISLITIDGAPGSGKTTLARTIAETLRSLHIRTETICLDSFVSLDATFPVWKDTNSRGSIQLDHDRERVAEVIAALTAGRGHLYECRSALTGQLAHQHSIDPCDVVIIEGCMAGLALESSATATHIRVECDTEVCRTRLHLRSTQRGNTDSLWLQYVEQVWRTAYAESLGRAPKSTIVHG